MIHGFETERELVVDVGNWFGAHGYEVTTEVPNMGQSVDLVVRGRRLFLIEAKRSDWRTAFKQCRTHEHVADAVWLALPLKSISSLAKQEALLRGYGIIGVEASTKKCTVVVLPRLSKKIWLPQQAQFLRHLEEVKRAN